jgi:mRNA interferase RelE/StbE
MTFRVDLRPGVERETRGIPGRELKQITAAIRRYAETGYGNVVAMKGQPGHYRLRVGEWRVRFTLDHASSTMVVQHILNRREAYRD